MGRCGRTATQSRRGQGHRCRHQGVYPDAGHSFREQAAGPAATPDRRVRLQRRSDRKTPTAVSSHSSTSTLASRGLAPPARCAPCRCRLWMIECGTEPPRVPPVALGPPRRRPCGVSSTWAGLRATASTGSPLGWPSAPESAGCVTRGVLCDPLGLPRAVVGDDQQLVAVGHAPYRLSAWACRPW